MKRNTCTTGLLITGLLLLAPAAYAHTHGATLGGFGNGLTHPFRGIDHLLAMLAVGLWASQLGGSAVWKVPLAFVVTLLLGAGIAVVGINLPFAETIIAASVVILGLVIALRWRAAPLLASLTVALFAVFHGYAHGIELPVAAAVSSYFAGFALATLLLHATGLALGYRLSRRTPIAQLFSR